MTEETLQKSVILPKNAEIEGAVFHNMIEIPENLAERLEKKLLTPMNTGMSFPKQVIATTSGDECLSAGINIAVARVGEPALLANGKRGGRLVSYANLVEK